MKSRQVKLCICGKSKNKTKKANTDNATMIVGLVWLAVLIFLQYLIINAPISEYLVFMTIELLVIWIILTVIMIILGHSLLCAPRMAVVRFLKFLSSVPAP
ncbi:hypothetical protein CYG49_00280 [Candidatus Saccharibacteria bacterium]|nr:MAG: hypothetical protein CYG49_00280 [Candidatus Saccharibacteria bacterium]